MFTYTLNTFSKPLAQLNPLPGGAFSLARCSSLVSLVVLYGSAGVWIWYGWGSRLVRKGVLLWYERVALWDFGFGAYTARSLGRLAGDRMPQLSARFREWTAPVSTHPVETQFNDVGVIQLFSTDGRIGDVEAAVAFDWSGCAGGAPVTRPRRTRPLALPAQARFQARSVFHKLPL